MKLNHTLSLLAAVVIGGALHVVQAASAAEITEFLGRMQSTDGSIRVDAILHAGPMGAPAVAPLADLASGTNRPVAIAAQTALKHMAAYAGRPGAGGEKAAMAEALARVLDPKFSKVTRCLALDLISITGDDPVVPNVAQMLKDADPDVRDEARRSLEGIPGKASLAALIDAAGKTEGKLKLAVLTSLGQRAAPEAADVLVAATESSDTEVVLAALESLARLGLPKDDRVRLPSWDGLSSSQQVRLANALLRWAELRAAKGAPEDALEIYGAVAQRTESEHLTCAALNGAAKAAPAEVFPYLVSALGRDENTVRMTAVHLLEKQPGDDAQIKALLEAYASAKAETREVILRVLKNWNGKKRGT